MKKITIIFIIAVCLLSFIDISFLAKEILSPGEAWNSLTKTEKAGYIRGFRDGIQECLSELVPLYNAETEENIDMLMALRKLHDLCYFIWEYGRAIITVIDDLYKDPANTYIHWPSMCEVACQKLKGEDVEQLLKEARKEGYLKPLIDIQEYKEKK